MAVAKTKRTKKTMAKPVPDVASESANWSVIVGIFAVIANLLAFVHYFFLIVGVLAGITAIVLALDGRKANVARNEWVLGRFFGVASLVLAGGILIVFLIFISQFSLS